ncbi:MAG: HAD family phosphatase [Patescibacteria group bacterium]
MSSKFAVFDIDGTLIRWQLYHAVVDRMAKLGHLGLDAHEKLHIERMKWKRRESPGAFLEYEQFLVKLYESVLDKLDPRVFDRIAREIAYEYKDQVYTYTKNLLNKLKQKGYFCLAISGSHHELVGLVAKDHGFDDWIGSIYHRAAGKFTGNKQVSSHDKASTLKSLIKKHQLNLKNSYAVGDTASDVGMLAMVENPIAFNPNSELLDHAKNNGWPLVIERKNVVYELKYLGGKYQLANPN